MLDASHTSAGHYTPDAPLMGGCSDCRTRPRLQEACSSLRVTEFQTTAPTIDVLRWGDGLNVRASDMEDGLPLPGHPAETAPRNSSLLERVFFVISAFGVYSYFDLLDFLPFPAALVVAILSVPVLAELMVRTAARIGIFP